MGIGENKEAVDYFKNFLFFNSPPPPPSPPQNWCTGSLMLWYMLDKKSNLRVVPLRKSKYADPAKKKNESGNLRGCQADENLFAGWLLLA